MKKLRGLKLKCETKGLNPRDVKIDLAKKIIKDFHSDEDANLAQQNFLNQFSKGNLPDKIEELEIHSQDYNIADLLVKTKMVGSKGEAKRLIKQGGVRIYDEKVEHAAVDVSINPTEKVLLRIGKLKYLHIKGR